MLRRRYRSALHKAYLQQGLETQRIYLNLRRRGVGTGVGEADVALHLHWRRASQSIDSGGAGNRTILHLFCRVMHTMLLHFREVGLVNRVAKALSISPLKATSAVAVGVGVYDGGGSSDIAVGCAKNSGITGEDDLGRISDVGTGGPKSQAELILENFMRVMIPR